MKPQEMWFCELPDECASDDIWKLAKEQAETRLKDLDATMNNISGKAYNLLTILAGVVIAGLGYVLANETKPLSALLPAMYAIIHAFALLLYVISRAFTGMYQSHGIEPKLLTRPDLYTEAPDKQLGNLYRLILEELQDRIEANVTENRRRWGVLNLSIWLALAIVPAVVLIFFVSRLAEFGFFARLVG